MPAIGTADLVGLARAVAHRALLNSPQAMRSIPEGIVEAGDVIGAAGRGRTVLAVTVENLQIDEPDEADE